MLLFNFPPPPDRISRGHLRHWQSYPHRFPPPNYYGKKCSGLLLRSLTGKKSTVPSLNISRLANKSPLFCLLLHAPEKWTRLFSPAQPPQTQDILTLNCPHNWHFPISNCHIFFLTLHPTAQDMVRHAEDI